MDPQGVPPFPLVKTIHDLPDELLGQIFGYMSHTGKLILRLVCNDWCERISLDLSKSSYFELGSLESHEVLLNSNVGWTKLRISKYESSALPKDVKNLITTLKLDFSGFPAKLIEWKRLCTGFPNITDLSLNLDDKKVDSEGNGSLAQRRVIEDNFIQIMLNLKQLSITFPFNSYTNLKKFLTEFPENMCLTKLSIQEKWSDGVDDADDIAHKDDAENILSCIHDIIQNSSSTLKFLGLGFYTETIQSELIPDLVSKLCEIKDLKLQSVVIEYEPVEEHVERDFSGLQEFLNIQTSAGLLKDIILPWSTNRSLSQEFVKSLPQNIETVGNVREDHITDEFPTTFKKLRVLSIGGDITTNMSDAQCDSIQCVYGDARLCGTWFDPDTSYCFGKVMMNLTELKIFWVDWRATHRGFFDQDLQIIISNMHKLRILHLLSCDITDNGVIGLEDTDPDIKKLVLTKRLYFHGKCVPEENVIDINPLSSLKMLEELVLIGTRITDVGLVLGLQFGSQLKQLTIDSESDEVSDLGLHCLAANNPSLERFDGSFSSRKISMVGEENLQKQFPMIEFTRKFKFVNEPPEDSTEEEDGSDG